jgi:ketosteroid isomerase-like protein
MSEENVEVVKRFADAYSRRDVEAMLEDLDPAIEWHSGFRRGLEGETAVYRGHEGFRDGLRDLYEALGDAHIEYSEIRDLGVGANADHLAVPEVGHDGVGRIGLGSAYLDPKDALDEVTYRGLAGVTDFMREFLTQWEDFTWTAEDFVANADKVLVVGQQRARGRHSGATVEMTAFTVWTFRAGKAVHLQFFRDRRKALEAPGCGSRPGFFVPGAAVTVRCAAQKRRGGTPRYAVHPPGV